MCVRPPARWTTWWRNIRQRVSKHQRVLVTTLTKRMSEDLTDYLSGLDIKVRYLHSEINTLERMEILRDLRLGAFDVLVGINLLREGLDLPEVSLVAILDADKEGFLRSESSLIQTSGRASRHLDGKVIMYADSHRLHAAGDRRDQPAAPDPGGIQPAPQYHAPLHPEGNPQDAGDHHAGGVAETGETYTAKNVKGLDKPALEKMIAQLEQEMRQAAHDLAFEWAAEVRDMIIELRKEIIARGRRGRKSEGRIQDAAGRGCRNQCSALGSQEPE